MCGIAGIVGPAASRDSVSRMVGALRRRGPDDSGVWLDNEGRVALGHARLSIIDLSRAGHQPMISADGNCAIVFNGEVYNYRELRAELEALGAVFGSHSDTEVVLWGWRIWGKAALARFRGMFAFAVWDRLASTLTLVRDRMGIKPLLWHQGANGLVFGSTLKSLLASGAVPRVLNEQGLFDYLLQGAVLQPGTMLRDVHALQPGTLMTFKRGAAAEDGSQGTAEKYWSLERDEGLAAELARMPYVEQVRLTRQKLEEACKYHLIADVPVGSFLSGGVDSTAITALMSRLSTDRIKSFSIGYSIETGMRDELSEARMAAGFIGCDHTEVVLTGKEVADNFDDFIDVLDQPSGDGLNTYWVSKITRERGVKVALSGLGGDELFAGYDHFAWGLAEPRSEGCCGRWMDALCLLLYQRLTYVRQPPARCRHVLPLTASLITLRRCLSEHQLLQFVQPRLAESFSPAHLLRYAEGLDIGGADPMLQITKYECRHYLLNTLLRDADALSMGHGLEVRPIFLDHRLVEHALAVPASSKWRNQTPKAILKEVALDLLPPGFFNRKKTGFTLPTKYWMEHELKDRLMATLELEVAQDLFKTHILDKVRTHGNARHLEKFVFQVLILLSWLQREKIGVQ